MSFVTRLLGAHTCSTSAVCGSPACGLQGVLFTPPPTRLNSGRFDHLCSDYIGPWQAEHGLVKVAAFIVHDWWRGEGKGLVALGENLWGKKKEGKAALLLEDTQFEASSQKEKDHSSVYGRYRLKLSLRDGNGVIFSFFFFCPQTCNQSEVDLNY